MTDFDNARFTAALFAGLSKINEERTPGTGVGTLGEHSLHSVLKYWAEPDDKNHEISIGLGKLIADAFNGERVTEIQTRNFRTLGKKLERILPHYPVTLVYPVAAVKHIRWVDPVSGEITDSRKSPRKGTLWDVFDELIYITQHLQNPHLTVQVLMLEIEEYRLLCGWSRDRKKGSRRIDRIPLKLYEIISLSGTEAYREILKDTALPQTFTAAELARAAKINSRKAGKTVYALNKAEVIIQTGKRGRAYLYDLC